MDKVSVLKCARSCYRDLRMLRIIISKRGIMSLGLDFGMETPMTFALIRELQKYNKINHF